jgi:hypothetical protein
MLQKIIFLSSLAYQALDVLVWNSYKQIWLDGTVMIKIVGSSQLCSPLILIVKMWWNIPTIVGKL